MLGSDIRGVTDQDHVGVELKVIHHPNYHTVATQLHRREFGDDETTTPDTIAERLQRLGFNVTDVSQDSQFTFIRAVRTDQDPDFDVALV